MKKSKKCSKELFDYLFNNYSVWAVRLTKESLDKEISSKALADFPMFIVVNEGDGQKIRLHQHILVGHTEVSKISKKILTDIFKDLYEVKGNSEIMVQLARDKKKLAKYTLKSDPEPIFKGFPDHYLQALRTQSFEKDRFQKQYEILSKSLNDKDIGLGTYSSLLLRLKAECHQNVDVNTHSKHLISCGIRVGVINADDLTMTALNRAGIIDWTMDTSQKGELFFDYRSPELVHNFNPLRYNASHKNDDAYFESDSDVLSVASGL